MPLPPQKFREAVLQLLYSQDFGSDKEELIPFLMQELKATRRSMSEAFDKVEKIVEKLAEIDAAIASSSTEYSFERISRIERAILRLGYFELLCDSSIPPKVAIAEGIRLCRKFGTPESAQFINAILDGVYKKNGAVAEGPLSI